MRRLVGCMLLAFLAAFPGAAFAGELKGTVKPIADAPEVEVCVVGQAGVCTVPSTAGSYVLPGLAAGPYKVEFIPTFRLNLLPQYYDHVEELSKAKYVSVPAIGAATGIDAELKVGGVVEGTVTAAEGGGPLAEVEVCAVSVGASQGQSCSETNGAGEYELTTMPTGSYRVGFWGTGSSARYEAQYYATTVAVTAGAKRTGVDVALLNGAEIRGTVSAAGSEASLAAVPVCLYEAGAPAPARCTDSGEAGAYAFPGLHSGSYQVGFDLGTAEIDGTGTTAEVGGYVPQYFHGAVALAQATTISLLPAQTVEGVDAALLPPPAAPPSTPPIAVANPVTPPPPTITAPTPRKTGCKKGYKKKKVKGKVRCVKVTKHAKKKQHKKKKPSQAQGGKRS